MKQLRIVIADDSAMIRNMIREELSRVDGLLIVGEAEDGMHAFWLYTRMSPDVLILDLGMPKANGFEVLQSIRKTDQSTIIMIFTADPGLALRTACLKAGASFYFDKADLGYMVSVLQQLQLEDKS